MTSGEITTSNSAANPLKSGFNTLKRVAGIGFTLTDHPYPGVYTDSQDNIATKQQLNQRKITAAFVASAIGVAGYEIAQSIGIF